MFVYIPPVLQWLRGVAFDFSFHFIFSSWLIYIMRRVFTVSTEPAKGHTARNYLVHTR